MRRLSLGMLLLTACGPSTNTVDLLQATNADTTLVAVDAATTLPDLSSSGDDSSVSFPDLAHGVIDAGSPRDTAPIVDALPGALDGPPPDAPVTTAAKYWKPVFVDDFRGKTGAASDSYCFDQLAPQCAIWAGAGTNDCSLDDVTGSGIFPPTRANLVAALTLAAPGNYGAMSDSMIQSMYGQLVAERWASVNKCTWSSYEMINWMATDYAGHYSSRFDPTLVTVDASGKGYLELSAAYAPPVADCVYGGTSSGGPNCQVYAFAANVLKTTVHYWADPNPAYPGVYYTAVGGACPYGGSLAGPNCQLHGFAAYVLDPAMTYWVDSDPRWPGVYYADTNIACRDNIDYPNGGVYFKPLTCPVLNGGVLSMTTPNRGWMNGGTTTPRGRVQAQGRFEAKLRIPQGVGAFPAAWLMPNAGGWPFNGGEIDILEARDAADEVYQTYHHGRCVNASSGAVINAPDPGSCTTMGGTPVHLSHGYTVKQKQTAEFSTRDHLFAVEWDASGLRYYVNGALSGTIGVGTAATADPSTTPAVPAFDSANLPVNPFYWILNHSTYVAAAAQSSWPSQVLRIDYVKSYTACHTEGDFCPCGGAFVEGRGCVLPSGASPVCPKGMPAPTVTAGVYAAACVTATGACVNGGAPSGASCVVKTFPAGTFHAGTMFWVDADPRWPGVYYHLVNGGCPYGGSGTVNCQLLALPGDLVETGVSYAVDTSASTISYTPDFLGP